MVAVRVPNPSRARSGPEVRFNAKFHPSFLQKYPVYVRRTYLSPMHIQQVISSTMRINHFEHLWSIHEGAKTNLSSVRDFDELYRVEISWMDLGFSKWLMDIHHSVPEVCRDFFRSYTPSSILQLQRCRGHRRSSSTRPMPESNSSLRPFTMRGGNAHQAAVTRGCA